MNNINKQKKVSVIIPTFNRAKFIPSAVESVINQQYDNTEIIIVDDNSTDNTQAIVQSLQDKYPYIIYCHNERTKGPSGARNTGILKATGDYLSFLDSDDVWLEGHLMNGVRILNGYPDIDVLFGNFNIVDYETGELKYNFFDQKKLLHTLKSERLENGLIKLQDNLFIALIQENFFSLCSLIMRKDICKNILLDEAIMFAEDRDFAIKLYKIANATLAYRTNPVFVAYKHNLNIYNKAISTSGGEVLKAHLYLFTKYLNNYNLSNIEKRILTKRITIKLSSLSYSYGKNKDYQNALSNMLKSFKYGLTFTQIINIMKLLFTILLINSTNR
jgi:glycosyltransferase involved in cell wall biosynthesis